MTCKQPCHGPISGSQHFSITAHLEAITADSAEVCPCRGLNVLMKCSSSNFSEKIWKSSHYCQRSVDCYAMVITVACCNVERAEWE